nr:hypothetical protein [uncultured Draconibacterium sp.]
MKKRGLRKYYKKLEDSSFIENLDFSGGENSWFDYYHFHIDNEGLGDKSWKSRKQHLDALFRIASKIEEKLKTFPNDYQFWIEISETESTEDCIYIHTSNPNRTEFPISIEFDKIEEPTNKQLAEYLSTTDYDIRTKVLINYNDKEELNYFLTKNNLGLKIE